MDIISILKMLVYGTIEGITEWLPISSTGHLLVLEAWLDSDRIFQGGAEFFEFFLVAIQLGAILAVVVCFFNRLNPFFGKSLQKENAKKSCEEKKEIGLLWLKVLVATLPAMILGLLLDDFLDRYFYRVITVAVTLIVYGILFIVMEIWNRKRNFQIKSVHEISFKTAFLIGLFQVLALIPGTSRSGVTILGAMILLCQRDVAAEFSFFLSIPVMFGASLWKGIKYLTHASTIAVSDIYLLLIGAVVAFAVSVVVIRFLLKFVRNHDFKVFGGYRIAFGILLLILMGCQVLAV